MTKKELKALIDKRASRQVILGIEALSTLVDNLAGKLKAIGDLHNKKLDRPEISYIHPAHVECLADLELFITAEFGLDFVDIQMTPRKLATRRIRDVLALRYPNIERLNEQSVRHGYTAPLEKHSDTIYIKIFGGWKIIDICRDSTGNGTLRDNLQWNTIGDTPW